MAFRHSLLVSAPNYSLNEIDQLVVYVCEHSAKGALGLIINKPHNHKVSDILYKGKTIPQLTSKETLNFGGPVDATERMIVLHNQEFGYFRETAQMGQDLYLTTSVDALNAIGWREKSLYKLFLGMMQWHPGQLEKEVIQNSWFVMDYVPSIVFAQRNFENNIWSKCYEKLGFDPFHVEELIQTYQ